MEFYTADICDEYRDEVQILPDAYHSYGGAEKARGDIVTIKLIEENSGLIALLKEPGEGRIVVVDVEAAYHAVVGENLMKLAHKNGWAGLVIHGYIRDTHVTRTIPVGLWALGTCPRKCHAERAAQRNVPLEFNGITCQSGDHLLADGDGIIIAPKGLLV